MCTQRVNYSDGLQDQDYPGKLVTPDQTNEQTQQLRLSVIIEDLEPNKRLSRLVLLGKTILSLIVSLSLSLVLVRSPRFLGDIPFVSFLIFLLLVVFDFFFLYFFEGGDSFSE